MPSRISNRRSGARAPKGKADGVYGSAVQSAVASFQKANGLVPDGVVGPETAAKMNKSVGSKTGTASKVVAPVSKKISPNDSGVSVKQLQQALKKLGLLIGSLDDVYGKTVQAAVSKFQKANGLVADGIVGQDTAAKLNKQAKTTVAEGETVPKVVPPVSKSIGPNDTGGSVEKLQTALKKLGLYKGPVDGIYGKDVVAAVSKFQKANGSVADGVVGTSTAAKINKAVSN